jgi:hypothetical protein
MMESVKSFSMETGGIYEDIDLLLHEYVCLAPNEDGRELRKTIGEWSWQIIKAFFDKSPRHAASACVSFGKFATDEAMAQFAENSARWLAYDSVARQQAVVLLVAKQYLSMEDLAQKIPDAGVESSRQLRFLRALGREDPTVIGMCLNLIDPMSKELPDRAVVRPRALFLVPPVRTVAPGKWKRAAENWKKRLTTLPDEFRDRAAERWCGL